MAVRRKQIRQLVEALLNKSGTRSGHVPVENIARQHGITIRLDEVDDDLSGFLYRDQGSGSAIIGVNKRHHENRRRFTIAHELGHYFLHQGEKVHLDSDPSGFVINLRGPLSKTGESKDEKEANYFAAELLMPAKMIERDFENKSLDLLNEDEYLGKLAKKYKVSIQALTFRLASLGYIRL